MASLQLKAPECFNFKQPDDWPRWKRRFEQYRAASGLSQDSEEKQINALLYCMGEEAEVVLISTGILEGQRKEYSAVSGKFNEFFKVRRNVIFERARFNKRNQLCGESAEQYIMKLYTLAENCNYGDLTSEMMRDRLVVGIQDETLSQKLQLDPTLTLDKAKQMIRQKEAVREQQQALKKDVFAPAVEELKVTPKVYPNRWKRGQQTACPRCGLGIHPREKCPAKDAKCYRCQRNGHFASQCRSKTVARVYEEDEASMVDSAFLGNISLDQKYTWNAKITLCGKRVEFKLDTGAEVSALSDRVYYEFENKPFMIPARKKLFGPARTPLEVM